MSEETVGSSDTNIRADAENETSFSDKVYSAKHQTCPLTEGRFRLKKRQQRCSSSSEEEIKLAGRLKGNKTRQIIKHDHSRGDANRDVLWGQSSGHFHSTCSRGVEFLLQTRSHYSVLDGILILPRWEFKVVFCLASCPSFMCEHKLIFVLS